MPVTTVVGKYFAFLQMLTGLILKTAQLVSLQGASLGFFLLIGRILAFKKSLPANHFFCPEKSRNTRFHVSGCESREKTLMIKQ